MKILVDADACPVRSIIEKTAKKFNIKVIMITDVNHIITGEYSEVITVSQGKDSADMVLVNRTDKNDIVVTQDYGVASMALGKGAYAIGNSGLIYSSENIEKLLFERFLSAKVRRSGRKGGRLKGPQKRTKTDDDCFERNLILLCSKAASSI